MYFTFNYQKAIQAIVFFAQKEGNRINRMKALKLVYFADRYHLRKYGSLITNDEYYAMEYGPVASGVKDILELSDFLDRREKEYAVQFLKKAEQFHIEVTHPFQSRVLSQTEIEALSFAWEKFGQYDALTLSKKVTHQYPEWKRHEQTLKASHISRVMMHIEDFLDDPEEPDAELCHPLSLDEKHDTLEELQEYASIEALWES